MNYGYGWAIVAPSSQPDVLLVQVIAFYPHDDEAWNAGDYIGLRGNLLCLWLAIKHQLPIT